MTPLELFARMQMGPLDFYAALWLFGYAMTISGLLWLAQAIVNGVRRCASALLSMYDESY